MSITVNQMQIQAAKLNLSKIGSQNNQSEKVSGSSNSSFFDILQSMLGGNTVRAAKAQDNANDFNNFAKDADSLRNKLQSNFKNTMKNIKETVDNAALSNAEKSAVSAVSSGNTKDTNSAESIDLDSVSEIVKKAVVSLEEKNPEMALGNMQDVQVDIMLILQLLGVPPNVTDIVGQQTQMQTASGLNLLNIESINNTDGQSVLGINLSALGLANNINGVAENADADENVSNIANVLVDLESASKILSDIAQTQTVQIPQMNRQAISDLAAKFTDMANMKNIAADNQDIMPQDFKTIAVNNIIESIRNIANSVQTLDSGLGSNPRSVVLAQRLSALLEANGIDSPEILKEADVKISPVTDEDRVQNIRDILGAMKMKSSGSNLFGKTEISSGSVITENTSLRTRAQISTASLISENTETDVQPEILTQTAAQFRQISLASVNKAIDANFQNTSINAGANVKDDNADMINTSEFSNTLSGIVDIRSNGETVNAAKQQNQVAELRTHIANAANEISNIVAKNRMGGNFEMKLKLLPEGLGEVLVKVMYNKGNVNLNIVTDNKSAETQLLSQIETLKESLASHDFNLTGFDVGTRSGYEDNYNRSQENESNGRNFRNHFNTNQQTDNEDSANTAQNIQKLSNLYMNRIVYKTI